jgi:hypothetical protein
MMVRRRHRTFFRGTGHIGWEADTTDSPPINKVVLIPPPLETQFRIFLNGEDGRKDFLPDSGDVPPQLVAVTAFVS